MVMVMVMVMDGKTHIMTDPKVLAGKPVIKGTRISVELVTVQHS